jgi:hypothetical protein
MMIRIRERKREKDEGTYGPSKETQGDWLKRHVGADRRGD